MTWRVLCVLCVSAVPGALAQNWEVGGAVGYGFYRSVSMITSLGTAKTGIRNRFVLDFVLGQDRYEHLGGEFRYTYHDGDPFLEFGGQKANIQGQSHAFEYDLLFYTHPRDVRLRPYITAGVGAKLYRDDLAAANPGQPLASFGRLAVTNDVKVLVTAGAGVKYRASEHLIMRFDFRDYVTPFPKAIIVPPPGATARGLFNQFTPSGGVSYTFGGRE